jgi:hypothetical protein
LNKLRSPVPEIHGLLQHVFHLCAEFDFDLLAKWIPREDLTKADALSREPDPSDWALSSPLFAEVIEHFQVEPAVDIFASNANHVVDRFVSQVYVPGCAAIDATRLDWRRLLERSEVAWLFPPTRCVSLAISLLEQYKVEALICMPVRPGSNELIQLHQLDKASKSAPFLIPRVASSCILSCRVPSEVVNPAFLGLGVIRISWL